MPKINALTETAVSITNLGNFIDVNKIVKTASSVFCMMRIVSPRVIIMASVVLKLMATLVE
ncbi:hypothetical protein GCM10011425_14040 [Mucilaginibacter galii]|uniref:Uncharacterized protein n=1 Tax=Mucilaginibacter galii TaxID=2005073 RepID=A0A917J928_9SPHI|nr:hypothetical protein GCM10011425_14040 [Mucilaginibacter galii]